MLQAVSAFTGSSSLWGPTSGYVPPQSRPTSAASPSAATAAATGSGYNDMRPPPLVFTAAAPSSSSSQMRSGPTSTPAPGYYPAAAAAATHGQGAAATASVPTSNGSTPVAEHKVRIHLALASRTCRQHLSFAGVCRAAARQLLLVVRSSALRPPHLRPAKSYRVRRRHKLSHPRVD